jgi:homogentisate 1,2-dioxygenase
MKTDLPDNRDTESNFMPINPRVHVSPTQVAWLPFDIPQHEPVDFVSGLKTIAGSGDPTLREGLATHIYTANASMSQKAFVNSDGDFLIVPQQGSLDIQTEFGPLFVQPGEIVVIQRGQRFRVELPDGPSRGYILEIWGANFELPELGPLGANGLSNARDFLYPKARYEIKKERWQIVYKLGGKFFQSTQGHSPFDVVAWHGNYVSSHPTSSATISQFRTHHHPPRSLTNTTSQSSSTSAPFPSTTLTPPYSAS